MIPFAPSALLKLLVRRWEGPAVGPIGFDLGEERLNLVQMEESPSGTKIRAVASLPYPESRAALLAAPRAFKTFVRETLRSQPFYGSRVVSCLPRGVRTLNVRYRSAPGGNEAQGVVDEVLNSVAQPLQELVIDYLPLRPAETDAAEKAALAVVAPRREVLAYLKLLTGAGLEVLALDIGPAALKRLVVSVCRTQHHPTVLLINFGRQKSYLTVVAGQRLLLDREVPFGEERLMEQLARGLGLEQAEALRLLHEYGVGGGGGGNRPAAREILRSIAAILNPLFFELADEVHKVLIYTASETRGLAVDQVYLLGSLVACPGIETELAELLALPVSILRPFAHFKVCSDEAMLLALNDPASVALATGLALRGVTCE